MNENLPWDRVASFSKSLKQEKNENDSKKMLCPTSAALGSQNLDRTHPMTPRIAFSPCRLFTHPLMSHGLYFQTAAQLRSVICVFFMRAIVCRHILAGTSSDELFVGSD